ncbi:MAG: AAA family ATPase [Desulfobulbaceae bacterium]|nr:AAA family ATPase [Desulfobulbaceae bacterium]
MYEEHFGFTTSPFSIAPDPHYLYMSERHKEALAHLLFGMRSDGGFVMLTGEVGTGKTTICRCLLEQIPDGTDIALILNPKLSVKELLEAICDEFGIKRQNNHNSIKYYVDHINNFLLHSHASGRKAVLIIDEAQNLSSDVLEQIRLLTNLETNKRKLLQIILLGQPELKDMLQRPELRQLAQRITARYHLAPLSESEVGSYVAHRIAVAGGRNRIFPASTIKILFKLSNGTPRLINIICDRSLLGAYVQDLDSVNADTLKKAAREVLGETPPEPHNKKISGWIMAGIILLFSGSVLATAYYDKLPDFETLLMKNQAEDVAFIEQPVVAKQEIPPKETEEEIMKSPALPEPSRQTSESTESKAEPVDTVVASADEILPPSPETPDIIQQPPPLQTSLLEWPENIPLADSRNLAYQALFDSWGIAYTPEDASSACAFAESQNLRCLYRQGSFNSLLALNRPAVLTLYDNKGQRFYAAFISYHEPTAELIIALEHKIISIEDIRSRWIGEYSLLWQKPEGYAEAIKVDDHNANVDWLDKKLSIIQARPASSENPVLYDHTLASQVKRFQFEKNLVPDGIVGPQTIILLNSASGSTAPKLIDTQEDK